MQGWAIVRGSKSFVVTHDRGRSWELQSINIPCNAGTLNVEFLSANTGVCVCPLLYVTNDVGKSWQRAKINSDNKQLTYDYLVRAISGSLIAININREKVSTLVSNNNGETWDPL